MKNLTAKLKSVLDAETDCYGEMNRLLDQEKRALSFSRHGDFDCIQHQKETLVGTLQRLEHDRHRLAQDLAGALDLDASTIRVSQLVSRLDPPQDAELDTCSRRLRQLIDKVRVKNGRNRQLIKHYLELMDGSLQLLSELISDASVYTNPGNGPHAPGYDSNGGRLFRQHI